MKKITTSKGEFVAVEVPDNIKSVEVIKFREYFHVNYKYVDGHRFTGGGYPLFYKDFGGRKKYPKDLELIGKTDLFTEEMAEDIVEKDYHLGIGVVHKNYVLNVYSTISALKSFNSLLQANEITGNTVILKYGK